MIRIKLVGCTEGHPLASASHAAKMCYQAEPPEYGQLINVKGNLFETGHHTTLEHFFCTFEIDGISIGDVTFGLHLAAPFYNTDQRSGRFCAKMFANPDIDGIMRYIEAFYPACAQGALGNEMRKYIGDSASAYLQYMEEATAKARTWIKLERPNASQKYIDQNAPKFAQEQVRMLIPVIFPTGLDYTVNLIALASFYRAAWTPVMRYVTQQMVDAVVERFPEVGFMFNEDARRTNDWQMPIVGGSFNGACYKPKVDIVGAQLDAFRPVVKSEMHPLDLLHYIPECMENSVSGIETQIEISVATMGQDQRHRTLRRGLPSFTGQFYVPPLLCHITEPVPLAMRIMSQWLSLVEKLPRALVMILAPYGAMVTYRKSGSFNAIAHEQAKRLCWCAQEEIYHLSRALRSEVVKSDAKGASITQLFDPPCRESGVCGEGARYCGRALRKEDYFPERVV